MGTGIGLKCPKCSFKKGYNIGVGFSFPRVYERIVQDIKNYEYGEEWRDFFQSHPGAAINAEKDLYYCRYCNTIAVEYNLDLYNKKDGTEPEKSYVALWCDSDKYELVKHYAHHCPNCDGRMRKVSSERALKSIPCPRCKSILQVEKYCWD
jgi:hypothetical protein